MKRRLRNKGHKKFLSILSSTIGVVLLVFFCCYPKLLSFVQEVRQWIQHKKEQLVCPCVFSFHFEHIYSQSLKQKIIAFLQQQVKQGNLLFFQSPDFYSSIKKNFDIIKKISWKRVNIDMIRFYVVGAKPCYKINNTHVIAENRILYDLSYFQQFSLEMLDTCYVDAIEHQNLESFFLFLTKISSDLWKQFSICYVSAQEIILHPKQGLTKTVIITDENSFFDEHKKNALTAVFHDLFNKNIIIEKKIYTGQSFLTFDMRFKNRLIVKVSSVKRGRGI